MRAPLAMLLLASLAGCAPSDADTADTGVVDDTADTDDSGDTADTGDTGDTGFDPDNAPPVITSDPDRDATQGALWVYAAMAEDPEGDLLTWEIVDGPDGLGISATGLVQWTPGPSDDGAVRVEIGVSDGRNPRTTQSFELTVGDGSGPPRITSVPDLRATPGATWTYRAVAEDPDDLPTELTWSPDPDGGATISASGEVSLPIAAGTPSGTVDLTVVVRDPTGNADQQPLTVGIAGGSDRTPPTLRIDRPTPGQVVTTDTAVIGTATDESFAGYTLELCPAAGDCRVLEQGTTPVDGGELGVIPAHQIPNGDWTIVLTATDADGNSSRAERDIDIQGEKFGKVKLAFADLVVNRRGGSFTLTRTYDGFDTSPHELGHGWSYELDGDAAAGTVELTTPLHEGWTLEYISFPPSFVITPSSSHVVILELSDGRAYSFYVELEHEGGLSSLHPVRPSWSQTSGPAGARMRLLDNRRSPYSTTAYDLYALASSGTAAVIYEDLGFSDLFEPTYVELTTEREEVLLFDIDGGELIEGSFGGGTADTVELDLDAGEIRLGEDVLVALTLAGDRVTRALDVRSGAEVSYRYDASGDLVSATEVSGDQQTFVYGPEHDLRHFDVQGAQPAAWWYGPDGRLIRQQAATGELLRYTYDDDADTVTTTDAAGNETVVAYDVRGRTRWVEDALGHRTAFTYADDRALPATITDPLGHVTAYRYDDAGRRTRIENALGEVTQLTYADDGVVASGVTDPEGRFFEEVVTDGTVVGFRLPDGTWASRVTAGEDTLTETNAIETSTHTYDDLGRPTLIEDASGRMETAWSSDGRTATTTYGTGEETTTTFDVTGRVIALEDDLGDTFTYHYDGDALDELVGPDGTTVTRTHDAAGRLLEERLDGEPVRRLTYDSLGRLASTWTPAQGVRTLRYDPAGQLIEVKGAAGSVTHAYDAAGRRTKSTASTGEVRDVTYDDADRIISKRSTSGSAEDWTWDRSGRPASYTDGGGRTVALTYDRNGRLASLRDPGGAETRWTWHATPDLGFEDAYPRTITGFDGVTFTYDYSGQGDVEAVTDSTGGRTTLGWASEDTFRITDPAGRSWSFRYDEGETALTWPGGGTERWTGSDGDETWSRVDGTTVTTASEDGVVTVTAGAESWTQTLDLDAGTVRETNVSSAEWHESELDALGDVVSVVLDDGSALDLGRTARLVETVEATLASGTWTTAYAHDVDGQIASVEDPSGDTASFERDDGGRIVAIERDNGVTTEFVYTTGNRPDRIEHRLGSTVLLAVDYTYDRGRLVAEDWSDGTVHDYDYDALGRLDQVDDLSLTFDRVGNLVRLDDGGSTTRAYDADDRLLSQSGAAGSATFAWSDRGALLSRTVGSDRTDYVYDGLDRLESVDLPDGTSVTYRYDLTGRLLSREDGDGERRVLPLPKNGRGLHDLAALVSADGSDDALFVHGPAGVHSLHGADDLYLLTDVHGSVVGAVDASGSLVGAYRYDAWGKREVIAGDPLPYGWLGEFQDPDTGLVYLRQRWYDPTTGRFLTPDRYRADVDDPRTLHRYLYGLGDPLNRVDRNGNFSIVGMIASINISSTLRAIKTVAVQCAKQEIKSQIYKAVGTFVAGILADPVKSAVDQVLTPSLLRQFQNAAGETEYDELMSEFLCNANLRNALNNAVANAVPFSVEFQVKLDRSGPDAYCGARANDSGGDTNCPPGGGGLQNSSNHGIDILLGGNMAVELKGRYIKGEKSRRQLLHYCRFAAVNGGHVMTYAFVHFPTQQHLDRYAFSCWRCWKRTFYGLDERGNKKRYTNAIDSCSKPSTTVGSLFIGVASNKGTGKKQPKRHVYVPTPGILSCKGRK